MRLRRGVRHAADHIVAATCDFFIAIDIWFRVAHVGINSMVNNPSEAEIDQFLDEHLKEFYPGIGRIASVWAMLEFRMDQLIWDLAKIEQIFGACITTQLNGPSPRLRTIKALIELHGAYDDLITKVNKYGSKIVETQEKRNRTIHDPWFVGTVTKNAYQMRVAIVKNKIVYQHIAVTSDELKEIFIASKMILVEFNSLSIEIRRALLVSSGDKLRARLYRTGLLEEPPQNRIP